MLELPRQHVVSPPSYENTAVSAFSLSLFVSLYYYYCSTGMEYSYTASIERSVVTDGAGSLQLQWRSSRT